VTGPTYEYLPSLDQLTDVIRRRSVGEALQIIGLSGYGGSGKSTLARLIADKLSASVVSIDDFGTAQVMERSDDWNGLDRIRLVQQVLQPLRSGQHSVRYDRCDDWDTWHTSPTTLTPVGYLIVEGIGLFHPDVLPYLDAKVWVDVSLDIAIEHGIEREHQLGRRADGLWRDVWGPNEVAFDKRYQPKAAADVIVRPRDTASGEGA